MRLYIILMACLWAVPSPLWGKIVFYSDLDRNYEICVMDANGRNRRQVTFNEAFDINPAWSPNAQQIVFQSDRDMNWEIYVMDVNGKNQRRLTHNLGTDAHPDWSPGGSRIAFESTPAFGQKREIYVMDTDGRNVKQVTDIGSASSPRWSPDGEWILFDAGEIYAIRPDGTDLWQVSSPRLNTVMFLGGWSPDGKQVLYVEAVNEDVNTSYPVIATLSHRGSQKVIRRERVKVPRMPLDMATFSADGKSILFMGEEANAWHIYRFRLINKRLIQLTKHSPENASPREWSSPLSVPRQQEMLLQCWGHIKTVKE